MKRAVRDILLIILVVLIGASITFGIDYASAETMYVNVVNGSFLNAREEPNKNADILCRFDCGDEVNVIDIVNGKWAMLDYGGEEPNSYVSIDYLTGWTDGTLKTNISSNGRVLVRTKPGGKKVKDYLKNGDGVTVLFIFDGWAYIGSGWIDSIYLEEVAQ